MKKITKNTIDKAYNILSKFQGDALQLRILTTPYYKLDEFERDLKKILFSNRSMKSSKISKEEIEKDYYELVYCLSYLERLIFLVNIFTEYIELERPVSFDTYLTSNCDDLEIKMVKEFLEDHEQECIDY